MFVPHSTKNLVAFGKNLAGTGRKSEIRLELLVVKIKHMVFEVNLNEAAGMMWKFAAMLLVQEPELKKDEVLIRVLECLNFEQVEGAKASIQDSKHEFISDWKRLNNL